MRISCPTISPSITRFDSSSKYTIGLSLTTFSVIVFSILFSTVFTTVNVKASNEISLRILDPINVKSTSATLRGEIITGTDCEIQFEIREKYNHDIDWCTNWKGSYSSGDIFEETVYNLKPNTVYEYIAGARDSTYESVSDDTEFETDDGSPAVQALSITDFGTYYAYLRGKIIDEGGEPCEVQFEIREKNGDSWIVSDWHGSYSSGEEFTELVENLKDNTDYEFFACARNSYGEDFYEGEFTTVDGRPVVEVNELPSEDVGTNWARLNGYIKNSKGYNCEIRFEIWEKNNPSDSWFLSDWHGSYPSGRYFEEYVYDLEMETDYTFRAYARNKYGQSYDEGEFITKYDIHDAPFYLSVHIHGKGTVTISPEKDEYAWGDKVTLTAHPANSDYDFGVWECDQDIMGLYDNRYRDEVTIQMTVYTDIHIHAYFEFYPPVPTLEVIQGEPNGKVRDEYIFSASTDSAEEQIIYVFLLDDTSKFGKDTFKLYPENLGHPTDLGDFIDDLENNPNAYDFCQLGTKTPEITFIINKKGSYSLECFTISKDAWISWNPDGPKFYFEITSGLSKTLVSNSLFERIFNFKIFEFLYERLNYLF